MTHYFISDTHFGHDTAALEYSGRPFDTIEEHDAYLIDKWNKVVTSSDTVWHLGDFAHDSADPKQLRRIFGKLNGSKHLISGNHDKKSVKELPWSSVRDYAEISVDGTRLVLSHYPMRAWNAMRHGSIQLFGHCHGKMSMNAQQCDVGVDVWNLMPVDYPTIRDYLKTLPQIIYEPGSDDWTLEQREPALTV
ncbi:metallophosphoesterase family protein [Devosia sp. SD17-2]|uniref:metallophosphoesterase family protein n=1 Tax=Devosia sp. SD17-2 TaxID=2976459 RepID=UPI0023D87E55|nr:metallophosphoesterase family protein [Devosia sp. SD17-2]WEJ32738.1 metallophosphoesterase family protein [Devosia sp. SD17-2]